VQSKSNKMSISSDNIDMTSSIARWAKGIKLPEDFPNYIRSAIDLNQNGIVDDGAETRLAYETTLSVLDGETFSPVSSGPRDVFQRLEWYLKDAKDITDREKVALRSLQKKLPEIDFEGQRFRVHGKWFSVQSVVPQPHEVLFDIADAFRTYGPHMCRRWAEGEGMEGGLQIFVGSLADYYSKEEINSQPVLAGSGYNLSWNQLFIKVSRESRSSETKTWRLRVASTSPRGRTFSPLFPNLRRTVQHELGHAVDDFAMEGFFIGKGGV
jgi:hypothetical protein